MELLDKIEENPQSIEKGSLIWLALVLVPAGVTLLPNEKTLLAGIVLLILGTVAVFAREFRKL
jgi:hypothetical protein